MITNYDNGLDFINDNKEFLDTNPYTAVFFYIDAKLLNETNKDNYAIKVSDGKNNLLAIRVLPYNLVLFGNALCAKELFGYLEDNQYTFDGIICEKSIGDILIKNHDYSLYLGMDFMECRKKVIIESNEVIKARIDDLDEIVSLSLDFFKECGLPDIPNREKMKPLIDRFSIIKEKGSIVSMGTYSKDTDKSLRISHVYTKPQYRGLGLARKIVSQLTDEIIDMGFIATLNVDINNPISYHLYSSIGFKKLFTQGIYKKN